MKGVKKQVQGLPDRGPERQAEEAAIASSMAPELRERLGLYATLLGKWQKTINLVAPSTLDHVWSRHFADSLQVQEALPQAHHWVDLGSGGGFPGLVTAIVLADVPEACVHLIESDQRKCAFLREVARETGAKAIVHCGRIEAVASIIEDGIEAVSARALAPLVNLLAYAEPWLVQGAVGVFLKGADSEKELAEAKAGNLYRFETRPSRTQAAAQLILARKL
ncbi:16S rRNA (guanine(527)-N(7))-methyltransferase RsmG [Beijerinckia indica]|uniref:Ribosomal RNA small subunit methyltransferase G n=1 Tax=Beijerinckia indica subsp. indica (strain ATCC 9039 / DSM 1715 / NCIMB 8712) TaxID=395963 RepID=B2IJQ5_BEII9|nr:16S rRNA (guanine(527)-N(7))-methyltransferase RsmG [Beijerinckia indica]ACB94927.1 methyltransferase GidB [Beijerinckia indica subsp. indica ATCC 9039]